VDGAGGREGKAPKALTRTFGRRLSEGEAEYPASKDKKGLAEKGRKKESGLNMKNRREAVLKKKRCLGDNKRCQEHAGDCHELKERSEEEIEHRKKRKLEKRLAPNQMGGTQDLCKHWEKEAEGFSRNTK